MIVGSSTPIYIYLFWCPQVSIFGYAYTASMTTGCAIAFAGKNYCHLKNLDNIEIWFVISNYLKIFPINLLLILTFFFVTQKFITPDI